MEDCIFCKPLIFGIRKLRFEDKKGYWYTVVPKEIGVFGQVLMVVRKMEREKKHISDISDPLLLLDKERLLSVIEGINEISCKLKRRLIDKRRRKVEKIHVLTQCEGRNSHLHFQFLPRYEGEPIGNEFLYACELEEARWQDPPRLPPSERIAIGKQLLFTYADLLDRNSFVLPKSTKSITMCQNIKKLNEILR